jgi:uncharacterized protein
VTVADPTAEELELLLALQDTHSRIRRLEHQRDDLPEQRQLDEASARIGELQRVHDDVRLELEQAGARQRQLERETEVLVERRDVERSRLYDGSVANERQLRSVEAEIEATQRRITEHEDELLEVLERVEELETREAELETQMAEARQQVDQLTVARDDAAKGILAELAEAAVTRESQAADLPDDLNERFEAASQRAGGVGVGKLEQGTCSACRIELSRADIGELLAGPPLTTCPECRRLLVIPD